MIPPPPYLMKEFPPDRRGVLLPMSDRRTAAHGVSMYTVTRPTAFTVQRLAHAWTRALGAARLPGSPVAWSPGWPAEVWAEACRQWQDAVGPYDNFAVYQRRQSERDGLTMVLVREGRATAVVKVRADGESLAREQDALSRVSTYRTTTFGVPAPLGLGQVGTHLRWSAQEAVFQRPHTPELDPPRPLFEEIASSLGDLLGSAPGLVPAHNDLTPWNMRRDSSGRTWIFDWEDCGLAPEDADRAYYCASVRAVRNRRMPADLSPRAVLHVREQVSRRVTTNEPDERLKQDQIAALSSSLTRPTVLMVNPSFDLYGADLQLVMSAEALTAAGCRVVVVSPTDGPLRDRLSAAGADTTVADFPVLRRAGSTPLRLVRTGLVAGYRMPAMRRIIRDVGADVVYVNTLTLPWWLPAARSVRVPSLCHVHEAERALSPRVRRLLSAPLKAADSVIVNSRTTWDTAVEAVPSLRRSIRLVHNGVAPPTHAVTARAIGKDPTRLAVVGRLSERKGVHTALDATARLRARGRNVVLEVCGTAFGGHTEYTARLEERATRPDLEGAVSFSGYVSPVWSVLERADIVVAPSTGESFGNAVVEGQLALRPVVASAVGGHDETVINEVTGLLAPCGDAEAFAHAVERLMDDERLAGALVASARDRAMSEFSPERYAQGIVDAVLEVVRS